MTGPQHYKRAEEMLDEIEDAALKAALGDVPASAITHLLAAAQVHATLALTAAHAGDSTMPDQDWEPVLK